MTLTRLRHFLIAAVALALAACAQQSAAPPARERIVVPAAPAGASSAIAKNAVWLTFMTLRANQRVLPPETNPGFSTR